MSTWSKRRLSSRSSFCSAVEKELNSKDKLMRLGYQSLLGIELDHFSSDEDGNIVNLTREEDAAAFQEMQDLLPKLAGF